MPCFWTDFENCIDPSCFITTEIFATPGIARFGVAPDVTTYFSDAALSVAITPTTAQVTHARVYTQPNGGVDSSACEPCAWASRNITCIFDAAYAGAWTGSGNNDPRVFPRALAAPYSLVLNADFAYNFDPVAGGLGGFLNIAYASGAYFRVAVCTIATDLGICQYVVSDSACF